jgi:signal recognition particle GTPase
LIAWGATQAAWSVFRPILEDLAKDVAKDTAKSYVGKCFQNVFSVIHRKPLTKATGLAIKELLEQIENELLDADLDPEQVRKTIPAVKGFIEHPLCTCAASDEAFG